jgi:hypothetical protein
LGLEEATSVFNGPSSGRGGREARER